MQTNRNCALAFLALIASRRLRQNIDFQKYYCNSHREMSRDMRFQTMLYVRPAKAQTRLRIRAVWSEPLLVTWMFYEYSATDQTWIAASLLNRTLHRLVWVNTCQNATLLEITCCGSNDDCITVSFLKVRRRIRPFTQFTVEDNFPQIMLSFFRIIKLWLLG